MPGGWRDDVLLRLDAAGLITDVLDGAGQAADSYLYGPVVPGMPNLHSHGFQVLMGGLTGMRAAGPDSFWSWREAMYRIAARLGPDDYERCLAGVYLRMLRAGYTACAEFHYLHHGPEGSPYANPAEMSERVLAAARRAGLPVTLLPVLYCRSGFNASGVEPGQRRFALAPEAYLELVARCEAAARGMACVRVGVAPHSLRAVDPAALRQVLASGGDERPVHMHVAEQPREVEGSLAALGARPLEWLLDHHDLDARWCLVHATHTLETERARAAATGAVAGLCPTTEADLGDGIFGADHWLEEGGSFGIGSDANVRLSVSEELRLLEYTQRLRDGRRNIMANGQRSCGRLLYESAASGGARALGQPVGWLQVGNRADLVELDPDAPVLAGRRGDAVLDSYVFAGGAELIRSVWVAGRPLIREGRHANEGAIEAEFLRVMKSIHE